MDSWECRVLELLDMEVRVLSISWIFKICGDGFYMDVH